MRRNHQPLWLQKLLSLIRNGYTRLKIVPQFDQVGEGLFIFKPSSLTLFGKHIHAGKHLHIISSKHKPVQLSTWQSKQESGEIVIGDHVLISPGAQLSSAQSIHIGDNCMIAADTCISDSDWHGIYNRTRPFRCSAPITIKNNVWIGQRAIIGKGVSIGENSIVAAGAVVVSDVASNTIVGGNPAKPIKSINPKRRMLTREFLFSQAIDYDQNQVQLTRYLASGNNTLHWLRTLFLPSKDD